MIEGCLPTSEQVSTVSELQQQAVQNELKLKHQCYVSLTLQSSNFFMADLQAATGLEDESFNPLPPV